MRYVLVDRFLELEQGKRALAVKCVTNGEPFVRGLESYPGPLVLEALLQTGGVLTRAADPGRRTVLGKVTLATFPSCAIAGDRIELEVAMTQSRPDGTMCEGTATVDGRVVATAEFMMVFLPPELTPPETPELREQRRIHMRALGVPGEVA